MPTSVRFVLALLLLVLSGHTGSAQLRDLVGVSFEARIVSVIDGDTVDAIPAGEPRAIRIRLDGIDTPERGEPFSDVAQRFTRTMLFDKTARLVGRDVDRYGRLVARIYTGSTDASLALVSAGLACHYTQYSSDVRLASAQTMARREARGFWAAPLKPRCTQATLAAGANPRGDTPPAGAFHGNTDSHVYHAPSCPNYTCRNCTREFRTETEARAAGYRPAGDCLGR